MAEKMEKQEVREVAAEVAGAAAGSATAAAASAGWAQTRAVLRLLLIVLLVCGAMWALYMLQGVLLLLVLSIFFAYLIAPLVELARRPVRVRGRERVMPRPLAIGVVYLLIFGTLVAAVFLLLPAAGEQLAQFREQSPGYYQGIKEYTQRLERLYQRLPPPWRGPVRERVLTAIEEGGVYVQANAQAATIYALTHAYWLVLIPVLAFFLLKDADNFRQSALRMLPRGRLRWRGDELFQDVNSTLAAYIRAQLIACLLIGVICTVGFMLLGVPYALVLGLVAGFFEFIPLAGPLAVAIIAVVVASFHSPGTATGTVLFLLVLRIVHDYVTYPRIIGSGIHLHPLAVILAILAGAELAGIPGIFLAIPVIAVLSVAYRHWLEHRGADKGIVASLLQPAAAQKPAVAEAEPGGKSKG